MGTGNPFDTGDLREFVGSINAQLEAQARTNELLYRKVSIIDEKLDALSVAFARLDTEVKVKSGGLSAIIAAAVSGTAWLLSKLGAGGF